jgi:ribonuclease P protein component
VVSKKISNKATVRNKVKRQVRAVVLKKIKDIKKSEDIIIITLPGIERKEFLEIEEVINDSFKKLKLL